MRNAFRIFRRDMKRLLRSPAAVLVMIGVCIIPSLYAWFNIAAKCRKCQEGLGPYLV